MKKFYKTKCFLFFSMFMIIASCNNSEPWNYTHLLDPKDYIRYYENQNLLRKDLEQKDYVQEPNGAMHSNPHEMWEQTFIELNYTSTIIIRYDNLEDKSNIIGYDTWITTNSKEQDSDRFKIFIDNYIERIKNQFPKRGTQNLRNGNGYDLTLSNGNGYSVTIQNDLKQGNQFIVLIRKEH